MSVFARIQKRWICWKNSVGKVSTYFCGTSMFGCGRAPSKIIVQWSSQGVPQMLHSIIHERLKGPSCHSLSHAEVDDAPTLHLGTLRKSIHSVRGIRWPVVRPAFLWILKIYQWSCHSVIRTSSLFCLNATFSNPHTGDGSLSLSLDVYEPVDTRVYACHCDIQKESTDFAICLKHRISSWKVIFSDLIPEAKCDENHFWNSLTETV